MECHLPISLTCEKQIVPRSCLGPGEWPGGEGPAVPCAPHYPLAQLCKARARLLCRICVCVGKGKYIPLVGENPSWAQRSIRWGLEAWIWLFWDIPVLSCWLNSCVKWLGCTGWPDLAAPSIVCAELQLCLHRQSGQGPGLDLQCMKCWG